MAGSKVRASKGRSFRGLDWWDFLSKNLARWSEDILAWHAGFSKERRERLLVVKYEDLVANTRPGTYKKFS